MKQASNVMIYTIKFICNIHIDVSTYLYFCIVKNSMSYENVHLPNVFRVSQFNYQRKQAYVVKFDEIYFDLKVIKIHNLILQFLAKRFGKIRRKNVDIFVSKYISDLCCLWKDIFWLAGKT